MALESLFEFKFEKIKTKFLMIGETSEFSLHFDSCVYFRHVNSVCSRLCSRLVAQEFHFQYEKFFMVLLAIGYLNENM